MPETFGPGVRFATGDVLKIDDHVYKMWAQIDDLEGQMMRADEGTRIFTTRQADEAQPAGHRTYFAARRAITIGCESLVTLKAILDSGHVTPTAPMFMLRPMLEAGFHGVYLLESTESAIRRKRGLAREIYDAAQRDAWLGEYASLLSAVRDTDAEARQRARNAKVYEEEALALGTTYKALKKQLTVVDELRRLETLKRYGDDVRLGVIGAWRFLSGCDHGLLYPAVHGGQNVSQTKIEGGYQRAIAIDDRTFSLMASHSALMLRDAMALYVRRSTETI